MSKKERGRFYISIYIRIFCFCANLSISDDIDFLRDRSENGCEKWHILSEIGSGFKEPRSTPPLRIPRSTPLPPQDSCEDIPWTWITLFTLSKIWKIRRQEEEDWIFNTQKLSDRKSNQQSLSPDRHLCFLLSCFYKQTSAFMSIPPPLSAGDSSSILSGSVKSLPLLLNQSPRTCRKKPLVSRVHPQTFVTIYVGSSIFSLTSSSGIFRGRGNAFSG